MAPWAHTTLSPKRRIDRFDRFCSATSPGPVDKYCHDDNDNNNKQEAALTVATRRIADAHASFNRIRHVAPMFSVVLGARVELH